MNKKGFLLAEETLKIIIGVIAIILLIVFLVALYNNYTGDQFLTQAKSSLTNLVSIVNSGATSSDLYNPTDALLLSFSSSNNGYFPKLCTSNGWAKCLCICNNDIGAATSPTCDESGNGICQQSDFSVNGQTYVGAGIGVSVPQIISWKTNSILISNPPVILTINQQTKTISQTTSGP